MQMNILSGGLSDPADRRGLAYSTATLLREGTLKRTNREIAVQTESTGGTLTANSGLFSLTSTIASSGIKESFDQTLDIFADVIRNPQFPAAEVEKFKTFNRAQIQQQRLLPNDSRREVL